MKKSSILVIDGANATVLIDNNSFDNGTYDINRSEMDYPLNPC